MVQMDWKVRWHAMDQMDWKVRSRAMVQMDWKVRSRAMVQMDWKDRSHAMVPMDGKDRSRAMVQMGWMVPLRCGRRHFRYQVPYQDLSRSHVQAHLSYARSDGVRDR
jgi:hypothetical protein